MHQGTRGKAVQQFRCLVSKRFLGCMTGSISFRGVGLTLLTSLHVKRHSCDAAAAFVFDG
jgi:hypothetical protein